MHHPTRLNAMQPRMPVHRGSMIQVEDETSVSGFRSRCSSRCLSVRWELSGLPRLAFIFAEILDNERFHAGNGEQALARGVDGKAAEVAGNPPPTELFGDNGSRATADKAVENQITMLRRRSDNPFERPSGFSVDCRLSTTHKCQPNLKDNA